jgi:hypothetical protein
MVPRVRDLAPLLGIASPAVEQYGAPEPHAEPSFCMRPVLRAGCHLGAMGPGSGPPFPPQVLPEGHLTGMTSDNVP